MGLRNIRWENPLVLTIAFSLPLTLATGLLFLGSGIYKTSQRIELIHIAEKTSGTVVDLNPKGRRVATRGRYPVVEFSVEGKKYRFTSTADDVLYIHERRETVAVVYDPRNPALAEIDGFWELWYESVFSTFVGSLILVVGLSVAAIMMKHEDFQRK